MILVLVVEPSSDDEIQQRVAEKLQSFVVVFRRAAMRERLLEELGRFETVFEALLSPSKSGS